MTDTANPRCDNAAPDGLILANAESLAYVAWCQEQIAENCYVVRLPPKPWAGRDDLVNKCSRNFRISDLLIASNAVDQAVLGMWHRQGDDPANFLKQAMRLRLQGIRQLILEAMKNGRREQTFKYEPHPDDPMKLIEMKMKEKRYVGTDMAAVDKLLAVERVLADLEGLWGDTQKLGANIIEQFFCGLDKLQEKNKGVEDAEENAGASRALRAKNRKLTGPMNESQHRLLTSIVTPTDAGQPEEVSATVVTKPRGKVIKAGDVSFTPEDDDEDDEEE